MRPGIFTGARLTPEPPGMRQRLITRLTHYGTMEAANVLRLPFADCPRLVTGTGVRTPHLAHVVADWQRALAQAADNA